MRYLLDTCVLSDFARGRAPVLARIKATPPEALAITSVTLMEVEYGLRLNAALERRLRPVMEAFFSAVHVLPYTADDARATAALRATLKAQGRPMGAYDALIAGCALARGLSLVTSNTREFARVAGLVLEDWRDVGQPSG
ncbi:MAG: type II toxin-antitoxin system VapC family toxin [Gammaproteobacteria bacterium]